MTFAQRLMRAGIAFTVVGSVVSQMPSGETALAAGECVTGGNSYKVVLNNDRTQPPQDSYAFASAGVAGRASFTAWYKAAAASGYTAASSDWELVRISGPDRAIKFISTITAGTNGVQVEMQAAATAETMYDLKATHRDGTYTYITTTRLTKQ